MTTNRVLVLPDLPVARHGEVWHLVAGESSVQLDDPVLSADLTRLAGLIDPGGRLENAW
ncbi:hypothetical protein ACFVH7_12400 [Kitasatospora indigofera]|uniref:hypothetical protein n=1 Tax=Kitasatospora indigofera TaxID=67307 RepID=UPI003645D860